MCFESNDLIGSSVIMKTVDVLFSVFGPTLLHFQPIHLNYSEMFA